MICLRAKIGCKSDNAIFRKGEFLLLQKIQNGANSIVKNSVVRNVIFLKKKDNPDKGYPLINQ